jgi:hypothetical protein
MLLRWPSVPSYNLVARWLQPTQTTDLGITVHDVATIIDYQLLTNAARTCCPFPVYFRIAHSGCDPRHIGTLMEPSAMALKLMLYFSGIAFQSLILNGLLQCVVHYRVYLATWHGLNVFCV